MSEKETQTGCVYNGCEDIFGSFVVSNGVYVCLYVFDYFCPCAF